MRIDKIADQGGFELIVCVITQYRFIIEIPSVCSPFEADKFFAVSFFAD